MTHALTWASRAWYLLFGARPAIRLAPLALITLAIGPGLASANPVSFETLSGAKDSAGDPIDAKATFTLSAGHIEITLQNLLVDQKDVGQNVTGLSFSLPSSTTASVVSSSGTQRLFTSDTAWTDSGVSNVGWGFTNSSGNLSLSWFGRNKAITGNQSQWTLIGAPGNNNQYNHDNGSLGTNNAHNPFLANTITWELNVAGVTADTTISNVVFAFGTTAGDNHQGSPVPTPPSTPEPSTLISAGIAGVVGLALARRRRRTAA